jgi:hypothetical protein
MEPQLRSKKVISADENQAPFTTARWLLREFRLRQPWLFYYSLTLAAAVPLLLSVMALDDRMYRGVSIWLKPLKFVVSTIPFALTTAWFVGLLPVAKRNTTAVRVIALTLIATSLFEILYIGIQAALGSASHYNVSDPFHAAMFVAMAIAAWALTGTQAALAIQITRHTEQTVFSFSVVIGLWLTFILASVSGMMLGGMQPPAGSGVPVLSWHMSGGDIRPPHFLGVHAHQLIPLAGWLIVQRASAHAKKSVIAFAAMYALVWIALVAHSFIGRA